MNIFPDPNTSVTFSGSSFLSVIKEGNAIVKKWILKDKIYLKKKKFAKFYFIHFM